LKFSARGSQKSTALVADMPVYSLFLWPMWLSRSG